MDPGIVPSCIYASQALHFRSFDRKTKRYDELCKLNEVFVHGKSEEHDTTQSSTASF